MNAISKNMMSQVDSYEFIKISMASILDHIEDDALDAMKYNF